MLKVKTKIAYDFSWMVFVINVLTNPDVWLCKSFNTVVAKWGKVQA